MFELRTTERKWTKTHPKVDASRPGLGLGERRRPGEALLGWDGERREELLISHLPNDVVVRLLEHGQVAEVERPEVVVRGRLRLRALASDAAAGRRRRDEGWRGGRGDERRRVWSRRRLLSCRGSGLVVVVVVAEDLRRRAAVVEVVRRLRVADLGHKVDLARQQVGPVHPFEKRVRLDFVGAAGSEATVGVRAQQAVHEVTRLGRDVELALVPVDAARQNVFENLLGCLVVKRWHAVQEPAAVWSANARSYASGEGELVADDTEGPLRTRSGLALASHGEGLDWN